jgi:hypothetical protein
MEKQLRLKTQRLDAAIEACADIDWQQVVLNGGPPCFFVEGGRFCLRAERWEGHGILHGYASLADLLNGPKLHGAVERLQTYDSMRQKLAAKDSEIATLKGAMAAQDEREHRAGKRCLVFHEQHGCDWPDAVADTVLLLRAQSDAKGAAIVRLGERVRELEDEITRLRNDRKQ